ncbi:hypothetical protein [Acinetobacter pittii]|uniref:hypothetical protein n=1 Tax=Acinetobacter pittii TaxID=48296 RepID=UPI000E6AC58D|nr:hypothetical protein [Acinetobacter pittii]
MFPEEGTVGKFRKKMYRGLKKQSDYLHNKYASDAGDYGRGEYWTDNEEFAAIYGEVISKEIELDNVYCIPQDQVLPLIYEYETCKMELGAEKRLENATKLTEMFKAKGYSAVLTTQYESPDILGLCIFSK